MATINIFEINKIILNFERILDVFITRQPSPLYHFYWSDESILVNWFLYSWYDIQDYTDRA